MKPEVERLEDRLVLTYFNNVLPPLVSQVPIWEGQALYATGSGPKAIDTLAVYDHNGYNVATWHPFGGNFTGGLRVAMNDINGDGYKELVVSTAPSPSMPTLVMVYDGKKLIDGETTVNNFTLNRNPENALVAEFYPFGSQFSGGAFVAVAQANYKQPKGEIVVGADAGSPQVKTFDEYGTNLSSFYAYDQSFGGGVRVGAGDVDGDGKFDIVTVPGPGGGPQVDVWYGDHSHQSFSAFAGQYPNYRGGLTVAVDDVNYSGKDDIVVSSQTQMGVVSIWTEVKDNPTVIQFNALPPSFGVGVHVGLIIGRTGPKFLEPQLLMAFDNTGQGLYYTMSNILNGNYNPDRFFTVAPGIFSKTPVQNQDPSSPYAYETTLGGWVS